MNAMEKYQSDALSGHLRFGILFIYFWRSITIVRRPHRD